MIPGKIALMAGAILLVSPLPLKPLAGASKAPSSSPLTILVCYPGGPVRAQDAKPALDSMLRVMEDIGGWQKGMITSHFASKAKECRRLMASKDPNFAIVSLGLFLEYQKTHHLVPVAQPRIDGSTTDRYRLMVRRGSYKSLEVLEGKTLSGTFLEEPLFLRWIVFKGAIDPSSYFKLRPTRQALRALRQVAKGNLDAAIVNQQQFNGLRALPFSDQLDTVFVSDEIPLMGVVANQKKTTPKDSDRVAQALSAMCTHTKGKELCNLFGIEGFDPADETTYSQVVTLWSSRDKP